MAVLNVRVDDHVRDELKQLAEGEGVTLSEYVRDLVLAAVVPVFRREPGDEPAPESMRTIDRQTLSLLHRILARVLPPDANDDDGDLAYQLERARVIEQGFTGEYWREVAGFRTELSKRDCDRVSDILEMFRNITFSIDDLRKGGADVDQELATRLQFKGFDHNDALEGHMAAYVRNQVTDESWAELKPQIEAHDNGNSHSRMLDVYMRMLAEYRRIMDSRRRGIERSYLLTPGELQQIADASVHPSNR